MMGIKLGSTLCYFYSYCPPSAAEGGFPVLQCSPRSAALRLGRLGSVLAHSSLAGAVHGERSGLSSPPCLSACALTCAGCRIGRARPLTFREPQGVGVSPRPCPIGPLI